jgi:hypothetical protein
MTVKSGPAPPARCDSFSGERTQAPVRPIFLHSAIQTRRTIADRCAKEISLMHVSTEYLARASQTPRFKAGELQTV